MRAFCTTITDPRAEAVLGPYAELMARVRHWSFKQLHVLQRPLKDVKSEAVRRFDVTARQFNGVRFDLDQAVNAWRGGVEFRISDAKESIEATAARITRMTQQLEKAKTERRRKSLEFRIRGKKQRLDILKGRVQSLELKLQAEIPKICFGGRKALREGEIWEWREKRASTIFLVGSKDEGVHGNQSAHWDGKNLTLRLPDALGGGFVTLSGVNFRYGGDVLQEAMARNSAWKTDKSVHRNGISWSLFRDELGRWQVRAMVDEPAAALKTDIRNGVIAIDVNVGHLAIAIIDRHGNPIGRMRLNFPTADVESGKAKAMIGEAVRTVCLLALEKGYGIAIEDLDFAKKKAGLREYGAAHARRLSGLAYAKFQEMIAARCKRDGIDFHKMNPAYTSVIGRTKYARARSMTPHDAAALVIGRRAMGYGERFVTMDDAILDGPARNRPRTEWRRWRGVRRLAREVPLEGAVRTARSDCEATGTGARQRASRQSGRSSARARIEPHHNQVGDAVVPATGNNKPNCYA